MKTENTTTLTEQPYKTYLDIKADYLNDKISFEEAVIYFFAYASHPDARELNIKQLRLWHERKTGVLPSKEEVEKLIPTPTTLTERTQGVWKTHDQLYRHVILDENKKAIATMFNMDEDGKAKANAEYICKAVNNHDALLQWCHKLYAVLFTSDLLDHKEMDALQEAIKKAEQ